jgi:hypothetical protein
MPLDHMFEHIRSLGICTVELRTCNYPGAHCKLSLLQQFTGAQIEQTHEHRSQLPRSRPNGQQPTASAHLLDRRHCGSVETTGKRFLSQSTNDNWEAGLSVSKSGRTCSIGFTLALSLLPTRLVHAQFDHAAITWVASDTSGAVVPHAPDTLTTTNTTLLLPALRRIVEIA